MGFKTGSSYLSFIYIELKEDRSVNMEAVMNYYLYILHSFLSNIHSLKVVGGTINSD